VTTLIYADRPPHRTAATPEGGDLWLGSDELSAATGWTLEPQGLCRGARCVRIPHGRESELVRETPHGSRQLNLAALARLLEQPVLRDDAHAVWYIGDAAPARRAATQSLQAPDFTLPDLDGRLHSLADYRGKKVFLVSWASW
jgi:AhpC/TSA family